MVRVRALLVRLASPAGIGLALLLFLVLPFLSVSCDIPAIGEMGATYSGADVTFGGDPTVSVPAEARDLTEDLGTSTSEDAPPDPGVVALGIVAAALMVLGMASAALPRLRTRLLGGGVLALLAAAAVVVTQLVAQANLRATLLADARDTGAAEGAPGTPEDLVDRLIKTEVGFWLTVVVLTAVAVANAFVLFLKPKPAS
jgi:hypothetical protein